MSADDATIGILGATEEASLLLQGRPRAAGVLAPAMAFEPRRFLDGLAPAGVRYE